MSCTVPSDGVWITRRGVHNRIIISCGCAGVIASSFLYAPFATVGPVMCPFRFLFGMPCPGCGLTRSFCAMSSGEFLLAFGYHLFGPLLYTACLAAVPILLLEALTKRPWERLHRLMFSRRVAYLAACSLIIYHAARILQMACHGEVMPAVEESALARTARFLAGSP
jgi:Protein of unknown function (DUF2752)